MQIKTKRGVRRVRNQRVINRRFIVTDYADCRYITVGKLYPVKVLNYGILEIVDDQCDTIHPLVNNGAVSLHLHEQGYFYHPIR